jgi:hypothetical protein
VDDDVVVVVEEEDDDAVFVSSVNVALTTNKRVRNKIEILDVMIYIFVTIEQRRR